MHSTLYTVQYQTSPIERFLIGGKLVIKTFSECIDIASDSINSIQILYFSQKISFTQADGLGFKSKRKFNINFFLPQENLKRLRNQSWPENMIIKIESSQR